MNNLTIIDQRNLLGKDFKVYGDFQNPLFLAKDVAEWIDYDKSSMNKMVNSVDEDEKVCLVSEQSSEGLQPNTKYWFLTEDGLYEVLMQSRKPIAKKFKKEVKKILKSIRINGIYVVQAKVQEQMFNSMKVEMEGLVNGLVQDRMSELDKYYRPLAVQKTNIIKYIKTRVGNDKEKYDLVKQRVLIELNATKWEDIPVEILVNSLNIIDESIRIINLDSDKQMSIWG